MILTGRKWNRGYSMKLALNLFIALIVLAGIAVDLFRPLSASASALESHPALVQFQADGDPQNDPPIMKPSRETRNKWFNSYNKAAKAPISQSIKLLMEAAPSSEGIKPLASLDLLSHLQYTPSQRNQGSCGNCWAWAGTGVMEIALDVQKGIKDRLSIQYLNSNYMDPITGWACCGGWLDDVAAFYQSKGKAIPWINANAAYADGSRTCASGSSLVSAASIVTTPNYPISSISVQSVNTQGVSQSTAIANIKNVLNQGKAVGFSFFLATGADWTNFRSFWNTQPETVIWDPDFSLGHSWDSGGGGHAVLCVGYDDSDPNPANHYWKILNSWGTASGGRPNGLFRLAMDMNYSGTFVDGGSYYSFYWQTLDITYTGSMAPAISTLPASSVNSTSATLNGNLTSTGGAATTVHIYWGDNDGGTTAGNWDTDINLGARSAGAFSSAISGLTNGTTYYYRCYAINSEGPTWAASSASFTAADPPQLIIGTNVAGDQAYSTWSSYALWTKYRANQSAGINQLWVKASGSGVYAKAAIFNDNNGEPGTCLGFNNTGALLTGDQYSAIPLGSSVSLTSGSYYWLAVAFDNHIVNPYFDSDVDDISRYSPVTYSSFNFTSSPSGLTHFRRPGCLAGWGVITPPVAPTLTNAPGATAITTTSATLNGNLTSTGNADCTVRIYWGDNDGITTPASWDNNILIGTRSTTGTFSSDINTLSGGTTYYYRCYATNSAGSAWASSTASFSTAAAPPPVAPTITNASGATDVTATSTTLNGNLTSTGGATTTVHIFWGDNDGGTTTGNWDTDINLGARSAGAFSSSLSTLTTGTTYYYRCYATNSAGPAWASSTASFTPQVPTGPERILGIDSTASTGPQSANYFLLNRFTAEKSGNLTQIRVYCGSAGNVKAALYADSSGSPGNLIVANNSGTPCTAGWSTINVASTPVTSGTVYWLAYISDTDCVRYQRTGGTMRYRPEAFTGFSFPSSAGSLAGPWDGYNLIAGWGSAEAPTPPSPPTPTSPGAAITFKWSSSSGATAYTLQLNTSNGFEPGTMVFNQNVGNVTSYEVSGLSLGTTYHWRVNASNASGTSAWSAARSIIVNNSP